MSMEEEQALEEEMSRAGRRASAIGRAVGCRKRRS
jgi:hypothetical protein